ncbi:MAG: polysulfide reductase NrfD [Deltaproteobacteria bacterium]|nr:polysulfide reductase NrfD [Deltaproteobacteria bacterium]
MRYGFVIDHNRCIGCHACTVACKEEHNVPIGVFRTWVKYVEKGEYPNTRRHFGVLRCNHCDDAPCVEICPTRALYRRKDGIVDFDSERCIGCKSCMQACPYDALYIDPRTNTAAKCNYCAHRVEVGLEPACVIVCPEQAIIAGDLDDPASRINHLVATQKVSMRKPEKGTKPKLFYVGVDEDLLRPTMVEPAASHLWAEKNPGDDLYAPAGSQGNGRAAAGAPREVYDVSHPRPWGRKVASYLWSKSIAAGVLLVAAILFELGYQGEKTLLMLAGPILSLFFLAVTTLLLIVDLKRPERFYYLFTKPNPTSWLVWGGYILALHGVLGGLWLLSAFFKGSVPGILIWPAAVLAAGSACYSAFLFAQAKGRDLWQSPLLLWHLLIQALMAGSATLILAGVILGSPPALLDRLESFLAFSLVLSLGMILGELYLTHVSEDLRRATDLLKDGALSGRFWSLVVGVGLLAPLVLLAWAGDSLLVSGAASVFALAGLWFFEDLWVRAGQAVPLS